MLRCNKCEQQLPDAAFAWKKLGELRQITCRKCHAKYRKKHYKKHHAKCRRQGVRWDAVHKYKVVTFLKAYFAEHPCVDCGETRLPTLDFDHVRGEKTATVAKLLHNHASLETIKTEIVKCDVRCSNCHRVRTTKKDWWRSEEGP